MITASLARILNALAPTPRPKADGRSAPLESLEPRLLFSGTTPLSETAELVPLTAPAYQSYQPYQVQAQEPDLPDITPPRVLSSSIVEGDVLGTSADTLTWAVQFSEAMDLENLWASLLATNLPAGSIIEPSTFSLSSYDTATNTAVFVRQGDLPEGDYQLFISDSQNTDLAGNQLDGEPVWPIPPTGTGDGVEGGQFFVNISFDRDDPELLNTFQDIVPLAKLIRESPVVPGRITGAGDADSFSVELEAGRSLSFAVTPEADLDTPPTFAIGIDGVTTAASRPGGAVVVNVPAGPTDRVIDFVVSADGYSDYRIKVAHNATREPGDTNSTAPAAIDTSRIDLPGGVSMWGASGELDGGQSQPDLDAYTLDLSDWVGQPIDLLLAGQQDRHYANGLSTLELIGPDGETVATTSAELGFTGGVAGMFRQAITGFVVPEAGLYQVQLSAPDALDYQLAVFAGGSFEIDPSTSITAHTRTLGPNANGIGYAIEQVGGYYARWFGDVGNEWVIHEIDSMTGELVRQVTHIGQLFPSALAYDGEYLYAFNLVVGSAPTAVHYDAIVVIDPVSGSTVHHVPLTGLAALDRVLAFDIEGDNLLIHSRFGLFRVNKLTGAQYGDGVGAFPISSKLDMAIAPERGSVFILTRTEITEIDLETGAFINSFTTQHASRSEYPSSLAWQGGTLLLTTPETIPGTNQRRDVQRRVDPDTGETLESVEINYTFLDSDLSELDPADLVPVVGQLAPEGGDLWLVDAPARAMLTLQTQTPFDDAGPGSRNLVDPMIVLTDANGVVLAIDRDSAADGKNALLEYTAATPGTYHARVYSEADRGAYVLGLSLETIPGDVDLDDDIDDTDLGIAISNFTGPIGAQGNKTQAQGDTDSDGDVDDTDLGLIIANFTGPSPDPRLPGDADNDGDIDDTDLSLAIANFVGPLGLAGGKSLDEGDADNDGDGDDTDLGLIIANFTGPLGPAGLASLGGSTIA